MLNFEILRNRLNSLFGGTATNIIRWLSASGTFYLATVT